MRNALGGKKAALAAVLALVALGGFAVGCGHHGHPKDPAQMAAMVRGRVDDLLDDVDATPDQRTKIHAIADRMIAAAQQAHAGHDADRATVFAQWRADQVDRNALHALVDQRVDALRALAHQAVDAGADAHDVLTPAQREKLAKKAERWHR
jgi:Spy/CpxP family protein refolding chaperone